MLCAVLIALGALLPAVACAGWTDLFADGDLDFRVAELPWVIAVGEHGVSVGPAVY